MVGQGIGICIKRSFGLAGNAQDVEWEIAFLGRRAGRGLFQNNVGVRATHAERIDTGAARSLMGRPGRQRRIDAKRGAIKVDGGVGGLIPQRWGDFAVVQCQCGFCQADHPRCGIEVANVGFDRPDTAKARGVGAVAVGFRQSGDLDRVAKIGAGAVAFDIVNGFGRCLCCVQRLADGLGLAADRGCKVARLIGPVVIDRRPFDNGPDMVTVCDCVFQPTQGNRPRARTEHSALRAVIERVAMPVG